MEGSAAIFDWDGVVIDSSAQHEESWERLAAEKRLPLAVGHFERSFGMKNKEIIPQILEWTEDADLIQELSDRKEVLYREILVEEGTHPLPGVVVWLRRLKEAGIPCVVGTSTDRLNVKTILELVGLTDAFEGIVSSEDVTHGKPHPEVFLKAAELVGAQPDDSVVFEDAPVGVAAGKAAGMRVVAVTSTRPRDALGEADIIVQRLDELSVDDLF